jgi:hypothetical protein
MFLRNLDVSVAICTDSSTFPRFSEWLSWKRITMNECSLVVRAAVALGIDGSVAAAGEAGLPGAPQWRVHLLTTIQSLIVAVAEIFGIYGLIAPIDPAGTPPPQGSSGARVACPQHPAVMHVAVSPGDGGPITALDLTLPPHDLTVRAGWDKKPWAPEPCTGPRRCLSVDQKDRTSTRHESRMRGSLGLRSLHRWVLRLALVALVAACTFGSDSNPSTPSSRPTSIIPEDGTDPSPGSSTTRTTESNDHDDQRWDALSAPPGNRPMRLAVLIPAT